LQKTPGYSNACLGNYLSTLCAVFPEFYYLNLPSSCTWLLETKDVEIEKAFEVTSGLGSRAIEGPYVAHIPFGQHLNWTGRYFSLMLLKCGCKLPTVSFKNNRHFSCKGIYDPASGLLFDARVLRHTKS
jgi:hypothetical protein